MDNSGREFKIIVERLEAGCDSTSSPSLPECSASHGAEGVLKQIPSKRKRPNKSYEKDYAVSMDE